MLDDLIAWIQGVVQRQGPKLIRFGAVSVFNVIFGQATLYGAQTILEWSPLTSNTVSVGVGAIPAYLLSRYWVWKKRGKNHLWGEVIPFWMLTFLGFALSTVGVWYVARVWNPSPIWINLTNLTAFGVVWVFKFVVLDRLLFRQIETIEEAAARSIQG